FADGENVGLLRGQDVRAQCTWSSTHTLYIPASANTDGNIRIELDSNDEVDQLAACNPSRANVTVRSIDVNYLATRTLLDPCGGDTKWEQAIRASDTVTAQSDAASPNIANFGLGLFYNTTAN